MNCCDEYGECRQGDDCPIRTVVVLPHQAACAARRKAAEQEAAEQGEPLSNEEFKELGVLFVVALLIVACLAWAAINLMNGIVFMWRLLL